MERNEIRGEICRNCHRETFTVVVCSECGGRFCPNCTAGGICLRCQRHEGNHGQACPKCGAAGEHDAAVKQYEATVWGAPAHIIDVGWACWSCGHEWGFEREGELGGGK